MLEDKTWFITTTADEEGHFHFDRLQPGKYVAGISLPGEPEWEQGGGAGAGVEHPEPSLYYPGMQERSKALAITLETDAKRDDINFIISTQ